MVDRDRMGEFEEYGWNPIELSQFDSGLLSNLKGGAQNIVGTPESAHLVYTGDNGLISYNAIYVIEGTEGRIQADVRFSVSPKSYGGHKLEGFDIDLEYTRESGLQENIRINGKLDESKGFVISAQSTFNKKGDMFLYKTNEGGTWEQIKLVDKDSNEIPGQRDEPLTTNPRVDYAATLQNIGRILVDKKLPGNDLSLFVPYQ